MTSSEVWEMHVQVLWPIVAKSLKRAIPKSKLKFFGRLNIFHAWFLKTTPSFSMIGPTVWEVFWDPQRVKQTNIPRDRQTDRQAGRHTGRQIANYSYTRPFIWMVVDICVPLLGMWETHVQVYNGQQLSLNKMASSCKYPNEHLPPFQKEHSLT